MNKLQIPVSLQPKSEEFLRLVETSPCSWLGIGGSRGGTKSYTIDSVQIIRRAKYPKTGGVILRRTFDELWENHIKPIFERYPFMREWYNAQHKEITLPNLSFLKFWYAEHKGDIFKMQGTQFMDIDVDEATHWSEEELVFIKTCNRWPGVPDEHCKFMLSMNPGNIGHAFMKRIFIDKRYKENENPDDYAFLRAYGWDNAAWCANALKEDGLGFESPWDDYHKWSDEERFRYFITRSQYGRELNALPPHLREAHLMGNWDIFAGQYFDNFDSMSMTIRPEEIGIEPWWPRWIGMDWGFEHPSVIHWNTTSPDGHHFTYRELEINHTSPPDLALKIIEGSTWNNQKERIDAFYLSPDAYAKRTDASTIAQQIAEVCSNHNFALPLPASNDRKGGWQLMYHLLSSGYWKIGTNCKGLIETLPLLIRDEEGDVEDVLKMDGDDPADSARYGLYSRLNGARIPLTQRVEKAMSKVEDITSKMIIQKKVTIQEAKKFQPIRRRSRNRGSYVF